MTIDQSLCALEWGRPRVSVRPGVGSPVGLRAPWSGVARGSPSAVEWGSPVGLRAPWSGVARGSPCAVEWGRPWVSVRRGVGVARGSPCAVEWGAPVGLRQPRSGFARGRPVTAAFRAAIFRRRVGRLFTSAASHLGMMYCTSV